MIPTPEQTKDGIETAITNIMHGLDRDDHPTWTDAVIMVKAYRAEHAALKAEQERLDKLQQLFNETEKDELFNLLDDFYEGDIRSTIDSLRNQEQTKDSK